MQAFDDSNRRHPLETNDSTCLFPAKSTGLASLCIQLIALVCSLLITIFFFYQIGGLDEIGITQNTTSLLRNDDPQTPIVDNTAKLLAEDYQAPYQEESTTASTINETQLFDVLSPFLNSTSEIPGMFEADAYDLIRISTYLYIGMCVVWMISLVLLLLSIKLEALEFVVINAFVCLVSALYLIVHAIFIVLLVVYKFETKLTWRPASIIFGTAGIQLACTFVSFFALILSMSWYKYIVYVNNGERYLCWSALCGCCCKKRKREVPQEYAMPEVTAHRPVPAMHRDFDDF